MVGWRLLAVNWQYLWLSSSLSLRWLSCWSSGTSRDSAWMWFPLANETPTSGGLLPLAPQRKNIIYFMLLVSWCLLPMSLIFSLSYSRALKTIWRIQRGAFHLVCQAPPVALINYSFHHSFLISSTELVPRQKQFFCHSYSRQESEQTILIAAIASLNGYCGRKHCL